METHARELAHLPHTENNRKTNDRLVLVCFFFSSISPLKCQQQKNGRILRLAAPSIADENGRFIRRVVSSTLGFFLCFSSRPLIFHVPLVRFDAGSTTGGQPLNSPPWRPPSPAKFRRPKPKKKSEQKINQGHPQDSQRNTGHAAVDANSDTK